MKRLCPESPVRRGSVILFTAVSMVVLLGFAALTIDLGMIYLAKTQLQAAADAAATAAASQVPDETASRSTGQYYAALNSPNQGAVLADSDVRFGVWDPGTLVFTEGGSPVNAVEVTVRRAQANGNPFGLFFASLMGIVETDISARAIAAAANDCSDRGIIAGNTVYIDDLEFDEVMGNFCIYGRNGVTIDELDIDNGSVTLGALDDATIVVPSTPPDLQIVEADRQPLRAQNINNLIDGIENGTLVVPGVTVVVLTGPVTFGDGENPGDVVVQPNTAYVVNGDARFVEDFNFVGENLTLAVRGTLRFDEAVTLHNLAPSNPTDLPLTLLATIDIIFSEEDVDVSGGALIAGRDFIVEEDFEPQGTWGLSIEAGRDVRFNEDLELEELDLGYAQAFGMLRPVSLVQ